MQTQLHKDVVKNITTASQLEGELQISQAQHGVAVLDIYNAEWGHCKALSETFRRLSTDAGDMVHLRFFSVECNAVLKSLRTPDDAKATPRPKGMEFSHDTLGEYWSKILEQRQKHSKPYFAFYKEGKMRTHLEGIDTPKICRIVHDLCKQQNAAAEYIVNADVLRFWESNFSPSESEVGTNEFVHAARALLGAEAADMTGDDMAHLTAAVRGGGGGEVVSASSLQSFVGPNRKLKAALLAVVAERRAAAGATASSPPPPSPPPPPAPAAATEEKEEELDAAPRAPSPKLEDVAPEEQTENAPEADGKDAYEELEGCEEADAGAPGLEAAEDVAADDKDAYEELEGGEEADAGAPGLEAAEDVAADDKDAYEELEGCEEADAGAPGLEAAEDVAADDKDAYEELEGCEEADAGAPGLEAAEDVAADDKDAYEELEGCEEADAGAPGLEAAEDVAADDKDAYEELEGCEEADAGAPGLEAAEDVAADDKDAYEELEGCEEADAGAPGLEAAEDVAADDKDAYEELEGCEEADAGAPGLEAAEDVAADDKDEAANMEELDDTAPYPAGEEDVVAASAVDESTAPPPSTPEDVNSERDVGTELDAPQETVTTTAELTPSNEPTPSPSPPHQAEENAAPETDESAVNQIFTNRWVTVSEEEMHVWNTVAALPLHYPASTTLMADLANDETAAREALPTSPETFPTLAEHLAAQGVPFEDVNMMCIAADQKVGSESLSYGKLSLILMSCDPEVGRGLVPECEQFLGELSAGTLLQQHQPLAFTALALSASEAYPDESFYYCLPEGAAAAFQGLSEKDVFILNALTPLNTASPAAGVFALRIIGLPKVIELATTDESDDTMVLSQWFARLRVVEQGADVITVHFVENVCDDEFQGFLNGYIARLIEDENRLDKKQGEAAPETAEELGEGGAYEIGDEEGGKEAGVPDEDAELAAANEL